MWTISATVQINMSKSTVNFLFLIQNIRQIFSRGTPTGQDCFKLQLQPLRSSNQYWTYEIEILIAFSQRKLCIGETLFHGVLSRWNKIVLSRSGIEICNSWLIPKSILQYYGNPPVNKYVLNVKIPFWCLISLCLHACTYVGVCGTSRIIFPHEISLRNFRGMCFIIIQREDRKNSQVEQ